MRKDWDWINQVARTLMWIALAGLAVAGIRVAVAALPEATATVELVCATGGKPGQ